MAELEDPHAEARRLEALWAGELGDKYIERNRGVAPGRGPFWRAIFDEFSIGSVMEVGCSIGANLRWLAEILPPEKVTGVDIALDDVSAKLVGIQTHCASARDLPFDDGAFDLTFTTEC